MLGQVGRSDLRELTLPWPVQVSLFGLLAVGYPLAAAGVYLGVRGSAGGIIAGSVFGAYPVVLVQAARALKKPHVRLVETTGETPPDGGIVCAYPHRWYAYRPGDGDDRMECHASINAARTVVTLRNEGWGNATRCRAWVRLEEADGGEEHLFPVRWERADNPLEMDLTSGEAEEVVLSEVDLYDRAFRTSLSNKLPDEVRETPHEYARAERFEIQRGSRYRLSVVVTADDTALVERPVDLGNGPGEPVAVPGFAERATEWGVLGKLRADPGRVHAVWFRRDGRDVLRVEEGFDLDRLRHADPGDQAELSAPFLPEADGDRPYRAALEDAGFVVERAGGARDPVSPVS